MDDQRTPAELDQQIREQLTDVRGGLPTGPVDGALELAKDEAGCQTLDELAEMQDMEP
jgi:hypothetical protein